jgi:integrase
MPHFPKPFFKKARRSWYVEIDRKQIKLGPDRDEAFRRYHELMTRPRERQVPSELLATLVDTFLEWCQKHRSPDTYEWYRYRLERFVRQYPELRVDELRPHHVQTWADGYESITPTTRRNYMRTVKRCLSWALKQGYVRSNPIAHLELPGSQSRDVVVTEPEYQALLSFVPDDSLRDLIQVTWETGCRPQESMRVESRHVDLENSRWVFPQKEAKGKRWPRIVYLTDTALTITTRLMLKNPTGTLFRNSRGTPWTADAVNCAFDRVRIRMANDVMERQGLVVHDADISAVISTLEPTRQCQGVEVAKTAAELRSEARRKLTNRLAASLAPRYSLYALRHTWATRALQNGLDGLTVAVLMGHSDPSTLARVYQHLAHNPQHLLEQAKRAAS